jgi:MFS family permease
VPAETARESSPHPAAARPAAGFARLWTSSACSDLADGLYLMLLPLVALELTRSPSLIAGIRVAQTAAGLLTGLPAGAVVDRLDRRRTMMAAELLRGGAMLALALCAALGGLTMPLLYAAAFAVGTAESINDTAAQAMVPMVVPRDRLHRANGRIYGTQTVMNDFVGAPLGAALFALGVTAALFTPAGLYFAACLALIPLTGRFTPRRVDRNPLRTDIRQGLAALWQDTVLRRLAVFQALAQLANMAFFAVFVVFAVGSASTLHLTKFGYSLLLTAAAVGAVSGSLASDRVVARCSGRVVLLAMAASLAVCFGVPALFAVPAAVAGGLVVSGFLTATGGIYIRTLRQAQVPEHMLGRVAAGSRVLSLAARPIGALLGGLTAQYTSPQTLFTTLALLMLTTLPLAWHATGAPAEADPAKG